jgi:hypothetical protein
VNTVRNFCAGWRGAVSDHMEARRPVTGRKFMEALLQFGNASALPS